MKRNEDNGSFWLSYSDLMTSMFFIMLTLFIVCIVKVSISYKDFMNGNEGNEQLIDGLNKQLKQLMEEKERVEHDLARLSVLNGQLQEKLGETEATIEQYQQILQIDLQFKELSKSSCLGYDEQKKMFYAKDFNGIEIFNSYNGNNLNAATVIKNEYLNTVREVGRDLQAILQRLHAENPHFRYQLVIEGTAAIPWREKMSNTYNPDNLVMYDLSYRRALALYKEWKNLDLRKYNTEIIIAGSGFNGINRDNQNEDNNKRFIIQIIPKVSRPISKN
ncbi:flagellar motor protein MotB [Parabacteroides sp. OttesenSCG-928-J18]|nr:flagellar motor protein MotB [Parabacteroides sp. OttesenSCG-928-J18]